jgi:hypothetical protein
MLELARLGQTDWRVERITPPDDCEFFVWLRRGGIARAAALSGQELGDQRMALLKRTLMAAQEQIDWSEIGQAKLQHVAALETELMETRARLDAILNSASWLVTRRLRRLLQKAPLPLQRALRQLLQPRGIPIEPPSPTSSARSSAASCART